MNARNEEIAEIAEDLDSIANRLDGWTDHDGETPEIALCKIVAKLRRLAAPKPCEICFFWVCRCKEGGKK